VHVADEMQEEPEGEEAFLGASNSAANCTTLSTTQAILSPIDAGAPAGNGAGPVAPS
jgi:hypothetical protein